MLSYYREGEGEPLVLVHGFLGSHRIYDQVIPELAKHYDVIAIDLPGHGKSSLTEEIVAIADYTDAILKLLDFLDVQKATWIGHSMGGYITMAAVEKYQDRVRRAALVYSSPVSDNKEAKEQREVVIQQIQTNGLNSFIQKRVPSYFTFDSSQEDISFAIKVAQGTTEAGAIVAIEAMKNRQDQVKIIDEAKIPILVLEGTKDHYERRFISKNQGITWAKTDTSHMGMFDDLPQFLEILNNWLIVTKL